MQRFCYILHHIINIVSYYQKRKQMILIKKTIKSIAVLCVIIVGFSCQSEEDFSVIDEYQTHIATTTEPYKIIKNMPGILYYHKQLQVWSVSHFIDGTIDSADNYLIVDMPEVAFSFEEGKEVSVSGPCYKIPSQTLIDLANKKQISFPVGTESFYLKVTDLNQEDEYRDSDLNDDIDMSDIDFSNIENLYELPLSVIKKCVQGKWQWEMRFGGVIGIVYLKDTYVEINGDSFIVEYEDGSQQKTQYTWERCYIEDQGYKTWVMWDNELDKGIWYFRAIMNDKLGVVDAHSPGSKFNQFGSTFVRIK